MFTVLHTLKGWLHSDSKDVIKKQGRYGDASMHSKLKDVILIKDVMFRFWRILQREVMLFLI